MKQLGIMMALLVGATGCGDDDRPTGDTDAGGITIMDSGPRPMVDSGTSSGVDAGGGSGGACADPLPPLPSEALPRCSAETLNCAAECTTGECQQACFDADTTPGVDAGGGLTIDCGLCFTLQSISCGSNMGCGSQWETWNCCLEDCSAGGGTAEACQTTCQSQGNAFISCVNGLGAACASAQQSCFPAGG